MEQPRAKKKLKKYGSENRTDIFDFQGDSDEGTGPAAGKEKAPRQSIGSGARSSGDTMALETPYLPRGNGVGIWRGAEPETMPPPALKSTISEQTQPSGTTPTSNTQYTSSGSKDTSMVAESSKGKISSSSADSDHCVQSSTISSRRSHGGTDQNILSNEFLRGKSELGNAVFEAELPEPSSSASVLSPSKTITVDRGDATFENSTPMHYGPETINPVVLLPENPHGLEENDELSLPTHGPETWSINQTSCAKAQKRKSNTDATRSVEPSSDDLGIGLPKDQYEPRPSKSRSGRGGEEIVEPVDFSKRPEAVAKKKSKSLKRSKITAFHELKPEDEDCESQEKYDHGISDAEPKDPEVAPEPNLKISPNPTVEKKETPEDHEQESLPVPRPSDKPITTKKQRGRPKKEPVAKNSDEKATDTQRIQERAPAEIPQTTAPSKKPKKGAKTKTAPLPLSKETVGDSDDELGDVDAMIRSPRKTLHETSGNGTSSKSEEKPAPRVPSPPSKAETVVPPPQTPPKANSAASKGPDKHSPISSAKAGYRVGLSKRARIAPLLRIVRKT